MELQDISLLGIYFISFTAAFCISIFLHELGHLVCGLLSGYRFVSYRVLKWLWTKDERGKIKLTASPGFGGTLGQCLMEPCGDEKDFRFVLYNAGGALANFMTGAVFTGLFFFVKSDFAGVAMIGAGISAFLIGLMNLIPQTKELAPNDGANIREALKSPEAKHGLYLMFKVNAEMTRGKRLRDYSEDFFNTGRDADTSNFLVANTVIMQASQWEECGAYEKGYETLRRLDPARLPPLYGGQWTLAMMYFELIDFDGEEYVRRARERIEAKAKDKKFQKLLTMEHPAFLPFQAAKKAFLDNDTDTARALAVKARTLAPTLQSPGQEYSLMLMLERLESRLNQEEGAPV